MPSTITTTTQRYVFLRGPKHTDVCRGRRFFHTRDPLEDPLSKRAESIFTLCSHHWISRIPIAAAATCNKWKQPARRVARSEAPQGPTRRSNVSQPRAAEFEWVSSACLEVDSTLATMWMETGKECKRREARLR